MGIHGIAQQFRGGYQLRALWFDAMRDGLVAGGHGDVADELRAEDLRVAFFGDLFRPSGAMGVADPPYWAADLQPGIERDLLRSWYRAAVEQDESLGPPEGAMGPGVATVQVMLGILARSPTFARIAQRAFIGNLKQVTAFLTDPAVKQNVLTRVRERMSPDTRVVIGHSLGSVVAYEYLCSDQPPSVELLVTLGSPLGIPNVVFGQLTPRPAEGKGIWPGTLPAWVNIADRCDIVALRKDLAPLFPGPTPDHVVADRRVDNGNEPHAAGRYLSTRETGSALGNVLC